MKELAEYFTRRYSVVNSEDDGNQREQNNAQNLATAAGTTTSLTLSEKQRSKSLNPNRSINPGFNVIDSFFNKRHSSKGARRPKCAFLLLAGGLLAITIAVLVRIFQPYELIFKWKLIFEKDGEIFNLWEKPPVELYIKIYLFNITNAEAFLAGREKMNVQEVGPYVYKELMSHDNVTFNENSTVSSIPRHPLVWQEHLSEGHREDDEVVMLDIAMLSIAHVAAGKSFFFRLPINVVISQTKSQAIVRMTAKEFMFGFQTQLTTLGNTLMPGWIYFDKVGLIDRMYDFDTDYETFYTGSGNPSISGLYESYRGSPNLPQWDGDHCSNIHLASDGTKFQSYIQPNDTVKFFRKSMCRPQALKRVGEEITYNSLSGYKYVFEDNAFDNGEFNEKNKCFCRKGYCQPRGLIDVTDCYYGFPISLSYPHFMDSDPGLMNNVTGLTPDRQKHSSEFILQPKSGMPLTLSVKIQINMHMRDVRSMSKVKQFSDTTFPMLWFEIVMPKLPSTMSTRFNFYLNILPYIDIVGFWGGLAIGVICLAFAVTRATIKVTKYSQPGGELLPAVNASLYSKANLLHSAAAGVYNPCEIKLIESNEKSRPFAIMRAGGHLQNIICPVNTDNELESKQRKPFIRQDQCNTSLNSLDDEVSDSGSTTSSNQQRSLSERTCCTDDDNVDNCSNSSSISSNDRGNHKKLATTGSSCGSGSKEIRTTVAIDPAISNSGHSGNRTNQNSTLKLIPTTKNNCGGGS